MASSNPRRRLLFVSLGVALLAGGCNSSHEGNSPMKKANRFGIPKEDSEHPPPPRPLKTEVDPIL